MVSGREKLRKKYNPESTWEFPVSSWLRVRLFQHKAKEKILAAELTV